jgi:RHS repeat-associated protein
MRFEYADDRVPIAMTKEGVTFYMIYDQVGSLRVVADSSGNVVKKIEYDSFGNIIEDSNPALQVPFGFAGGLHDRDTGLVRFGYRDYDPDVGRWTAKDPIFFAGRDTDLYGYVLNDPVNLIDPYGLKWYDTLTNIATGKLVKPVVAKYIDDPAGQRIITAWISGTAGGAVLGAVAGTPVVGIGAIPSAIGGALIGGPANMLKQIAKEAFGVPDMIDDAVDTVKDVIKGDEESPCGT